MPTVNDLENFFAARQPYHKGQVKLVRRILQEADLLPRGTRGSWRAMPAVTVEHAAWFLLGMASTNYPKQAANAAKHFAKLQISPEHGTFFERVVELINHHRDSEAMEQAPRMVWRLLFEHSPAWPAVEEDIAPNPLSSKFDNIKGETYAGNRYVPASDDADFNIDAENNSINGARTVPGDLILELAKLFSPLDESRR
jgi:hypothetical protein